MNSTAKPLLGWREWLSLPDLGLPAIKAKVDTGARTSALHVFDLSFQPGPQGLVAHFGVHPLQDNLATVVRCKAMVVDKRVVTDSGGHRELRAVIETVMGLRGQSWPIEITLTNRETMRFRLLLGRTAIQSRFVVDPDASYLCGKPVPNRKGKGS